MTVREEREVRAPPAKALAALATAGENLGYRVRDARAREGLIIMTSRPSIRAASLGFIVTARARRFNEDTRLALDATPLLGSWARRTADAKLDELVREFQLVLSAPHARIRKPHRTHPEGAPFGRGPRLFAILWALAAAVLFGALLGGWWWTLVALAAVGALLLFRPRIETWWTWSVVALAVLTLPAGLLGLVARRMAKANLLWRELVYDQL